MRQHEEHSFDSQDAARIFYRYWPAVQAQFEAPRAVVLLHRGHEHSGRVQHIVDELSMPGYAMFAWDARGHGRSHRSPEDQPSLSTFVKDLDSFVQHISTQYGIAPCNIAVIAQSVGSVLAATWVHDYGPGIRCMVLAAPAFKVKLYVPLARAVLSLVSRFKPDMKVKSYVKASALTHDAERIRSYESDPLITRPISVKVLLGLYSTAQRVIEDAGVIQTPVQLLVSGRDWVVRRGPQERFYERLGSRVKEKHVFDGFFHDTLGERERGAAIAQARSFIERSFSKEPANSCACEVTEREYAELSKALPRISPKRWTFETTRVALRTGGRLSEGIALGCRTGFDSGSSLDYVYRNRPSGKLAVGKLVDWFYLNSIGWKGIRVRRRHIERAVARTIERLRAGSQPVHVLDIAAGHGRYVLESVASNGHRADRIQLRDYDARNVALGRKLIAETGLDRVATFEQGDAFDSDSVAACAPVTLGIVSGLYELFPSNKPVRDSLAGLSEAIAPEGYLIYTGQPWHPQLEMIARVLSSHRGGKPWVMRRRTQAELDQLVSEAGFRKLDQQIDEWGIFTVSIAQRVAQ